MWSERKIGVRQHHCRGCGKALCEKCSQSRTTIPHMGFEFHPVRTCLGCYETISSGDRTPLATEAQIPTDVRQLINIYLKIVVQNKIQNISDNICRPQSECKAGSVFKQK